MVQENGVPVGMKRYPPEFKADAVALYRSRPGVTVASVAADLGVNTETLQSWIRAADRTPSCGRHRPDRQWPRVRSRRRTGSFAGRSPS